MKPAKILSFFRRPRELRYDTDASAVISPAGSAKFPPVRGRMVEISQSSLRVECLRAIPRSSEVRLKVVKALVFGKVRRCRELPACFDIQIVIDRVVMPLRVPPSIRPPIGPDPLTGANSPVQPPNR